MIRRVLTDKKIGMTLTEVVIAVAFMMLSIGGILGVVVQSIDLRQSGERAYIAANLARNRIERARQIRMDEGYSALTKAAETDTMIDANGNSDENGDYKRTTVVEPDAVTGLTKVTVRVKYKRRGLFSPKEVELLTLISQYS